MDFKCFFESSVEDFCSQWSFSALVSLDRKSSSSSSSFSLATVRDYSLYLLRGNGVCSSFAFSERGWLVLHVVSWLAGGLGCGLCLGPTTWWNCNSSNVSRMLSGVMFHSDCVPRFFSQSYRVVKRCFCKKENCQVVIKQKRVSVPSAGENW